MIVLAAVYTARHCSQPSVRRWQQADGFCDGCFVPGTEWSHLHGHPGGRGGDRPGLAAGALSEDDYATFLRGNVSAK